MVPNPYTFQPSDNGYHLFFVTFNNTGLQILTASDGTISGSANIYVFPKYLSKPISETPSWAGVKDSRLFSWLSCNLHLQPEVLARPSLAVIFEGMNQDTDSVRNKCWSFRRSRSRICFLKIVQEIPGHLPAV